MYWLRPLVLLLTCHGARMATKRIIAIRHSTTECNEALASAPWGSASFKDPLLWDTKLSPTGISRALGVHERLKQKKICDLRNVEVVLSSPLSRALHTADILFGGAESEILPLGVPKVAVPLLRERLYLSSDVGKPRSELERLFPKWKFDHLPHDDNPWWYTRPHSVVEKEWRPPGEYPIPGEPEQEFHARIGELKDFIRQRPEESICIVAHWGLLRGLFGINAANCEIFDLTTDSFLDKIPSDC